MAGDEGATGLLVLAEQAPDAKCSKNTKADDYLGAISLEAHHSLP